MFVKFCTVMGTVTTVPAVQVEPLPNATTIGCPLTSLRNGKNKNNIKPLTINLLIIDQVLKGNGILFMKNY
jgi:hypothetical protein